MKISRETKKHKNNKQKHDLKMFARNTLEMNVYNRTGSGNKNIKYKIYCSKVSQSLVCNNEIPK